MKKRFLAFMVCMAVLLASFTGCYSAQDGPSTLSSSQTMQSNSGSAAENSVEIRTYDIPEENVQAGTRYVPSPTTADGGFRVYALSQPSPRQPLARLACRIARLCAPLRP